MSRLGWFSGVLFVSAMGAMAQAIEKWWDDFLDLWGLFDPGFRRQWLGSQREQLDADQIISGGGNFDGAGTGGND